MFLLKKLFCFVACFMMINGHFCIQFNKINWNCMCLKGRYMKQYNILFCILTVGKHGTDARIQEFSSGGGRGGGGSRSV